MDARSRREPPSWDDLRVFHEVARHGSLTAGAQAADVDRSTASRRVTALERALGARLFLRTREGLKLSRAGERLQRSCAAMAEAAAAAVGVIDDDVAAGRVTLATTEGLALHLVKQGLLDVGRRHPGVVLELLGGNRPVDLARGEADLALRVVKPTEAALKVRRVDVFGFSAFASPAYVARRGHPRSLAGLAGHDVIVAGGELQRLKETKLLTAIDGARVAFSSSSLPAMVAAAAAGHGVVVVTRAWGEHEPGLLRLFDIDDDVLPGRALWLVFAPGAQERPATRAVADAVVQLLSTTTRAR